MRELVETYRDHVGHALRLAISNNNLAHSVDSMTDKIQMFPDSLVLGDQSGKRYPDRIVCRVPQASGCPNLGALLKDSPKSK